MTSTDNEAKASNDLEPQVRFLLFGRLRRDVMLLNSGEDEAALVKEAEVAVRTGRAAEAFVIASVSYFTEANVNLTTGEIPQEASSLPPLNPGPEEQETTDESAAAPTTTIQEERRLAAEEGPKGPDTGHNPDLTPTGKARSEDELAAGKPTGEVPKEDKSAKTEALDVKPTAEKKPS